MTGAGSSAFIGEALAGFIAKNSGVKCEAVHTTDIVSAPDTVLFEDIPTLLISFARSGNSPESAGAVQYARKKIKKLYEAVIVCNDSNRLYEMSAESKDSLVLVMPKDSNDRAFAMTSSVTCMMLAGFAVINYQKIDEIAKDILTLSQNMKGDFLKLSGIARNIAKIPFDRAVYLACGAFKGLAHEGSLKMLELTYGEVNTNFESATGFRHGPRTVIKDRTLTVHFISSDPFSAKYDIDLLKEVYGRKKKNTVIAVCAGNIEGIEADQIIAYSKDGYAFASDLYSGISGLVFFQMLAMFKSLEIGVSTDNPDTGGHVTRVVKNVPIYPY
jgi:tagatose-6-phosphate ketose/aldose isomerase